MLSTANTCTFLMQKTASIIYQEFNFVHILHINHRIAANYRNTNCLLTYKPCSYNRHSSHTATITAHKTMP